MSYDIQFGVKVDGTDIIATIDMPEYSDVCKNKSSDECHHDH